MALVRILVDGYSLLHSWPALAPGKTRHSPAAREELIGILTQYRDACGTPITIVFDGAGSKRDADPSSVAVAHQSPPTSHASRPLRRVDETPSTSDVEILYSRAGQTADQMIERAAHRLKDYGEVLVVTDDFAERDTVSSLGGMTSSCENFIRTVTGALDEMERAVRHYNQQERAKYRSH